MSQTQQPIIDTRYDQMFPVLEPSEIERVRRFGAVRSFGLGETVVKAGDVDFGLAIILAGRIEAVRRDGSGQEIPIFTQGIGAFLGELAQLAGRPALVDAYAREPVKALIIPPDRLRALIMAEAELGERIMRALILRRVGLLETGAGGPIIVGRTDDGDVLRLAHFLHSNSHPRRIIDHDTDAEAKALIERFNIDPDTGRMTLRDGDDLGPDFVLETEREERLQTLTLSRLSRLKEVRDGAGSLQATSSRRCRKRPMRTF